MDNDTEFETSSGNKASWRKWSLGKWSLVPLAFVGGWLLAQLGGIYVQGSFSPSPFGPASEPFIEHLIAILQVIAGTACSIYWSARVAPEGKKIVVLIAGILMIILYGGGAMLILATPLPGDTYSSRFTFILGVSGVVTSGFLIWLLAIKNNLGWS